MGEKQIMTDSRINLHADLPLITNATNQRNVFRIERAGRIGAWEEWEAPTLWTIYDPNQG